MHGNAKEPHLRCNASMDSDSISNSGATARTAPFGELREPVLDTH